MRLENAPVAFFIFNRPDLTVQVFAAIRASRPSQLFIVADGPRAQVETDEALCAETRRVVADVDWPCNVQRNYSENNLGCGRRMSTGITWVFEQTDRAIFLEDDCLPDPSFFTYCAEMLELYKNDERIGYICGSNLFDTKPDGTASYFYGKYPMIWGWASWRRVWQHYDFTIADWSEQRAHHWLRTVTNAKEYRHWLRCFDAVLRGEIDTWDYQVAYMAFKRQQLSVLPRVNLISNIGFREDATHTKSNSDDACLQTLEMEFPLKHPSVVHANESFSQAYVEKHTYPKLKHTRAEMLRRFFRWY